MLDLKVSLLNIYLIKPHEMYIEERVRAIMEDMTGRGVLIKPVVVERGEFVLLDGHHRFEALKRLGISIIPAVLVDYWDPRIVVKSWVNGATCSKQEVIRRALRGDLFPPRTTRHVFIDGLYEKHISEIVPEVNINISNLKALTR
ncbi:ParB N-terminal domain-containing protein [Infirmifilum lucidum]|uniref:ParB N-terminal domain-containing protein n=1 Tax=Infirmifilum lucidum TaxID=2776706 RepID=A0A7L9FJ15_9CREN|nr:ParB N-terminal domain-containing protein [Infirmifilum lucidum]QOJ79332.1 ParB N-terminal domain-containing protein [Infirmifilum lucidum]